MLLRDIFTLVVFVAMIGYVGVKEVLLRRSTNYKPQLTYPQTLTAEFKERCSVLRLGNDDTPLNVSMVYSEDKRGWIEAAAARFARLCRNIQVRLIPMEDFEAVDALVADKLHPTLFAPSSEMVLQIAAEQFQKHHGKPLFAPQTATSLVTTPLVWLVFTSRHQVLQSILNSGRSQEGPWMQFACSGVSREPPPNAPGNLDAAIDDSQQLLPPLWSDFYANFGPLVAAPEPPLLPRRRRAKLTPPPQMVPDSAQIDLLTRWGRVKFAHAHPGRASSGLATLYLLAYDFLVPPSARLQGAPSADLASLLSKRHEELQDWLRRCEAGRRHFADTTQWLTADILRQGPQMYDGVVTFEQAALPLLKQLIAYQDNLEANIRVVYPQPTIWNRHPVVLLAPDSPAHADERAAANKWIAYLLSEEMQHRAIASAFRPVRAEIELQSYPASSNPFVSLGKVGVQLDAHKNEPPRLPDKAVWELLHTWKKATSHY